MKKLYAEEILNHPNLLELIRSNSKIDDHVFKKLEKSFSNLKPTEIRRGEYAKTHFYLIDSLGVFRFHIIIYNNDHYNDRFNETPYFEVYENFDTRNKKDGKEILEFIPINKSELKFKYGRVYIENKNYCFELRLWTLVAEKLKEELYKKGLYHTGIETFFFDDRKEVRRDYCHFSQTKESEYCMWNFSDYKCFLDKNLIKFSAFAEKNLFREKYAEFDFNAIFNIKTGSLEIINHSFGSWNYK